MSNYLAQNQNPRHPQIILPDGAIDTHTHVIDEDQVSANAMYTPPNCSWEEQKRVIIDILGFSGMVFDQATANGVNQANFDDIIARSLVASEGRASAVITVPDNDSLSDEYIAFFDSIGARGARFAFLPHIQKNPPKTEEIVKVSQRIAQAGWHTDLYFTPENFDMMKSEVIDVCAGGDVRFVIDHMGRPDVSKGVEDGEVQKMLEMFERNKNIFMKLTCPERMTASVHPDDWKIVLPFAEAFLNIDPERCLLGTDRPHPNMDKTIKIGHDYHGGNGANEDLMVNDGDILNGWIAQVAPTEELRWLLMVANPRRDDLFDLGPAANFHPRHDVNYTTSMQYD